MTEKCSQRIKFLKTPKDNIFILTVRLYLEWFSSLKLSEL